MVVVVVCRVVFHPVQERLDKDSLVELVQPAIGRVVAVVVQAALDKILIQLEEAKAVLAVMQFFITFLAKNVPTVVVAVAAVVTEHIMDEEQQELEEGKAVAESAVKEATRPMLLEMLELLIPVVVVVGIEM